MTCSALQAEAGKYLAQLGARTPWAPLNSNDRNVVDATGRIVLHVIPTGDPAADHDLACAIAAAINVACGANDTALRHEAAVREGSRRFAAQTRPQPRAGE